MCTLTTEVAVYYFFRYHEVMVNQGLSTARAVQLLQQHGPNQLEQQQGFSPVKLLLSQFLSPLIYILLFAGVLTLVAGEYVDSAIIAITVLVNASLGFFQEFKAQSALQELSKVIAPVAKVDRDGKVTSIGVGEIVPGDVVHLEAGDQVPADGIILDNKDLHINEAILTGESLPVRKKAVHRVEKLSEMVSPQDDLAKHYVYMGTAVLEGKAVVKILATGKATEVGKIAEQLATTDEPDTPLQIRLQKLSRTLAIVVIIAAAIIFAIGMWHQRPLFVMLELAVALAVSAIPEGLLISLTVILSLGMQRILKRKALVRRLVAAETLGSVTTVCTDKTGTLTLGHLRLLATHAKNEKKMREVGLLLTSTSDLLEVAVHQWATKQGNSVPTRIIDEMPFSSEKKYSVKLTETDMVMVGAPEIVMQFLGNVQETHQVHEEFRLLAQKGYRLVGVATRPRREAEQKIFQKNLRGLKWLGFFVFSDPVRTEVKQALHKISRAHVQVKVITGDHALTAQAVMQELGLAVSDEEIMIGKELASLSESDIEHRIRTTKLFARTTPDQKLIIVRLLQKMGEVVAMTGDGVNDAPALKQADIGIVVSSASDVSKSTADIVLLDDNFKTIVSTVEEGRGIYENLRKVVLYLLANASTESLLVLGTLFLNLPLAISAIQVLWVNLVTDSFPSIALTLEPKEKGLLRQYPRKRVGSLFDRSMVGLIAVISLMTGLGSLFVFTQVLPFYSEIHAQTLAFTLVAIMSLLYTFTCRSFIQPFWKVPLFSNPWLLWAIAFGFIMQLLVVYTPFLQKIFHTTALTVWDWGIIGGTSAVLLVVIEMVKFFFAQRLKR